LIDNVLYITKNSLKGSKNKKPCIYRVPNKYLI